MRLDARNGDTGWYVWHVGQARHVENAVWVDDDLARWADRPRLPVDPEIAEHQAQRIAILPSRRLVLIDPVGNEHDERDRLVERDDVYAWG